MIIDAGWRMVMYSYFLFVFVVRVIGLLRSFRASHSVDSNPGLRSASLRLTLGFRTALLRSLRKACEEHLCSGEFRAGFEFLTSASAIQ